MEWFVGVQRNILAGTAYTCYMTIDTVQGVGTLSHDRTVEALKEEYAGALHVRIVGSGHVTYREALCKGVNCEHYS